MAASRTACYFILRMTNYPWVKKAGRLIRAHTLGKCWSIFSRATLR